MSIRKIFEKGNNRPSVLIQNTDNKNDGQWKRASGSKKPASLQKTQGGGSFRLTALSDMIRRYSVAEENFSQVSTAYNPSSAMEEINRLQWLMASKMPGISSVSIPANLADISQTRRTLLQLQHELEASSAEGKARWRPSEQTRLHDFIRDISLRKLEADTFKKLHIIYNNQVALIEKSHDYMPPFSPFGWTVEDFITRRHERNTVWLDMLLGRNEKELEILKFKCDLEELFKLLNLLFQGLKPSSEQARQSLFTFVHDAYEFLKFPQALKIDAKHNMEKLHGQVNTYLDMLNFKRGSAEEAYKLSLEQRLMDVAVIGPIELRYEVNWMHTKTDQAIMRMTNAIEEIENKATEFRREESKEAYCARCVLDMYYLDIDKYKARIAELSAQYDTELEKAENEIAYKKISMDKLREQRKFLEDEIVRFQREIEELQRKEMEEILAEEERKREEEQRALEEALQKQKAKGGKGKGKK